ncbi:MAG: glycosyltransferase [Thermoplasmataceae archaeon]
MVDKRIIVFYHRDPDNFHRGQGRYLRNYVNALSTRFRTTVIGTRFELQWGSYLGTTNLLSNILHSYKNIIGFYLQFRKDKSNRKYTIFIAEDIYVIPLALLISKISGVKILYRVSDFGKDYRKCISSDFPMSRLIFVISVLTEFIAVRLSNYLIVPSLNLKRQLITSLSFLKEDSVLYFPYVARPSPPDQIKIDKFKMDNELSGKFLVAFIGQTDYPPNVKAILEIFALAKELEESYPQIIFIIGGKGTLQFTSSENVNIKLLGEVDDLDTMLYSCHVGLTPVVTPGGLSMKTVDYLVRGLKVISTPEGALGIPMNSQMIVSMVSDFKTNLLKLYADFKKETNRSYKVSNEVEQYFLSNKDETEFLDRLDALIMKT